MKNAPVATMMNAVDGPVVETLIALPDRLP